MILDQVTAGALGDCGCVGRLWMHCRSPSGNSESSFGIGSSDVTDFKYGTFSVVGEPVETDGSDLSFLA